jgi:hypothetical protein
MRCSLLRGVEQRQLDWLITNRPRVRVPAPQPTNQPTNQPTKSPAPQLADPPAIRLGFTPKLTSRYRIRRSNRLNLVIRIVIKPRTNGDSPVPTLSHEQLAKTSVDVHPPATNGFSESSRKPTISWAFVLFQRISTGLSTGLSGLFIGTYSALAYAAYAGWRDASGPHAAPLRRRIGPVWPCIRQPYACPMQLPYSTSWRRSRVGRKESLVDCPS